MKSKAAIDISWLKNALALAGTLSFIRGMKTMICYALIILHTCCKEPDSKKFTKKDEAVATVTASLLASNA